MILKEEKNWQARYLGADFRGSTTRIQELFSLRQVKEVEQTVSFFSCDFLYASAKIVYTK